MEQFLTEILKRICLFGMELGASFGILSSGILMVLKIFFVTVIFSLPFGLLLAFGRMARFRIVRTLVRVYISVMRGTPLMLQLMVVFFAPYYLFGIQLSNHYRVTAALIGFVLNYAAYFAEIYRGGIESMPVGQYEAAKVLGYNRVQTFFYIIFPQVVRRILPSITNEVITLVKDTSLASVLALTEVFTLAKQLTSAQVSMMPYVAAAIFYYCFNFLVAFGMERLEYVMKYDR